ncbi:hypothetical protein [Lysinibacillus sphaericus]|uniref:hypothetical protein n=1 Tax=Lysinibacillus sphaericus TaxID=1421 RepID=UPI000C183812|nr:hypothetical protein [Lysinibacillus sphaericus]PIJ97989.1 hypothetical protein CTN02_09600 [Lysinibacillus sphaericus]
MREIKEAIWLAIRDNIIKKTWFKVLSVLFVILVGFVIYKVYFTPDIKKGVIGNKTIWEDFELQAEEFERKSKTLNGVEEIENTVPSIDGSKVESVINYFFFTANSNNADLFVSTLNPELLNKDFPELNIQERFRNIDESMNRISRNGQIEKIEVIRSLWVMESKAVRAVLDIYYKDLKKPIRINLIVKKIEQSHNHSDNEKGNDLPYIHSSVWDIIELIEDK